MHRYLYQGCHNRVKPGKMTIFWTFRETWETQGNAEKMHLFSGLNIVSEKYRDSGKLGEINVFLAEISRNSGNLI